MTEVNELVAQPNRADIAANDKCPFCYKEPVGHAPNTPEKVSDDVKSVPDQLKCDTSSWRNSPVRSRDDGPLPYTLAQHHLISAMQCYKPVRRLVRMVNMVGYDINDRANGIGLPTTHWTLKYSENYPAEGAKKKYGDLAEPEGKQNVAFALMDELGAQWHVGHHAFKVLVPKKDVDSAAEGGADENDDDDHPHEVAYDTLIVERLLNLAKSVPPDLCTKPERDQKFKQDMDAISKDIKDHLEKFKGENGAKPAESSPYFVSMRAYEYSGMPKKFAMLRSPPSTTSL